MTSKEKKYELEKEYQLEKIHASRIKGNEDYQKEVESNHKFSAKKGGKK